MLAHELNNLASIYEAQGKAKDAITVLEHALTVAASMPEPNDSSIGEMENSLALYCAGEGHAAEAEAHFARAAIAFEKAGDSNAASAAEALQNLASLYFDLRRYPEAAGAALRSLSLLTASPVFDPRAIFDGLNTLAAAYYMLGRFRDAERLLLHSRVIAHENFQASDPGLSQATAKLAAIYEAEGHSFDAIVMFSRALKAGEIALGPEHPWAGIIAIRLAVIYAGKGALAEAEPLFKRAIEIGERSPGQDGQLLAAALFNLAVLYTRQSRLEEAEALLKRSLDIRHRVYGPTHPAFIEAENALSAVQAALRLLNGQVSEKIHIVSTVQKDEAR